MVHMLLFQQFKNTKNFSINGWKEQSDKFSVTFSKSIGQAPLNKSMSWKLEKMEGNCFRFKMTRCNA